MKDHSLDSMDLLWLAGLARALVGDAAAGEDLAQDAALALLAERLPSLRLVDDQQLSYFSNITFRGPDSLHLEWDELERDEHGPDGLTAGAST